MEGRKVEDLENIKPRKGVLGEDLDEAKVIVGKASSPIFIGTAHELKSFFTPIFYIIFDAWRKYRIGLPYNLQDPDLIDILQMFHEHYEHNFSQTNLIIEYLGAIIKRLDARR